MTWGQSWSRSHDNEVHHPLCDINPLPGISGRDAETFGRAAALGWS
jgi:hypothetical protein